MLHVTAASAPPISSAADTYEPLLRDLRARLGGTAPPRLWEKALAGPLHEFLSRPGKQFRARLVCHAWRLAGRTDDPPVELPLLVELIHAGSLIVDDIEDGSLRRRGRACLHRLVGLPLALNTGNWLYFGALTLLQSAGLEAQTELALYRLMAGAMLCCHEGQALDLRVRVGELAQHEFPAVARAISEQKTGSLMGLAASVGAVSAGSPPAVCLALAKFGRALGVGLQMQNDLASLHPAPLQPYEDLLLGRVTWPWAWLSQDLPAEEFAALQGQSIRLADNTENVELLAVAVRDVLGSRPQAYIRSLMQNAFADLARAVGSSAALDELADELAELEAYHV